MPDVCCLPKMLNKTVIIYNEKLSQLVNEE